MIEQLESSKDEISFERRPLGVDAPETRQRVIEIIQEVRTCGWPAVDDYSREFDDVSPVSSPVKETELKNHWNRLESDTRSALKLARERIMRYQESIRPHSAVFTEKSGNMSGELIRPYKRVGCYIPGGRVPLPSTVLMTASIAEVAGVEEIVLCSPPGDNGKPHPIIQAAASLLKNVTVFGVGGVQAIAAMSYGAGEIPSVDLVVGPGNLYVTLAKKEVYGDVEIDMLAGPSEIAIIGEAQSTRPRFVAADLLSQAEHDPRARVFLFSPDQALIEDTVSELEKLVKGHPRGEVIRESLSESALVRTRDLAEAVRFVNQLAPEHLELQTREPFTLVEDCENAGAIFCGEWTPEPIGDYVAGPSHTLPTGGSARFFSPLSVHTFLRHQSLVSFTPEGYKDVAGATETLAEIESLPAHQYSCAVRRE